MVAGYKWATVALVSGGLGVVRCCRTSGLRHRYHAGILSRTQSGAAEAGVQMITEYHRILGRVPAAWDAMNS